MINPAVENALSDGTEVAGMHKYFRARVANFGKRELLSRQKSRMSALGISGVQINSQLVVIRMPFNISTQHYGPVMPFNISTQHYGPV